MVLKRKRSSSELYSSPSSGSSTSSSPPRQNAFNFSMMGASTTPSHQSGRTMKRLRNNRPTEQLVHRKLASAGGPASHADTTNRAHLGPVILCATAHATGSANDGRCAHGTIEPNAKPESSAIIASVLEHQLHTQLNARHAGTERTSSNEL